MDRRSFPYKREFIDVESVWSDCVALDLVSFETSRVPPWGWNSIPRGHRWSFDGETKVFYLEEGGYELNLITDYFTETARMKARRRGEKSPEQYYLHNFEALVKQGERSMKRDPSRPLRHWVREAIFNVKPKLECSTFRVTLAKAIMKQFGSKRVLDPSAGWGDRALGAAAASVEYYLGFDVNSNLQRPYSELSEFLKRRGHDVELVLQDFLTTELPPCSFDTVLTSPPYFDLEVYSDDEAQSIHGRDTVDAWTTGFLLPYLEKAWTALSVGGNLLLYILEVKGDSYLSRAAKLLTDRDDSEFRGLIAVTNRTEKVAFPLWCWRKTS